MKKLAAVVLFLAVMLNSSYSALVVSAEQQVSRIDLSGLTEEQRADLVKQAEQMRKQSSGDRIIDKITPENADAWVNLGKNMGLALAEVAKHLGVAADEFLKSSAGKITLALIVWKVMGNDLVHLMVGLGIFVVFLPLWVYFFRKMCVVKSVENLTPADGYESHKRYEYYKEGDVDGTRGVMLLVLVVIVATGIITIFSM